MTVRDKLLAICEPVPERQFAQKLLNVDKELYHVRATLAHADIDAIVCGLTDAYAFMHMNNPPRNQHQHGHAGRGRLQRRFRADPVHPRVLELQLWLQRMARGENECATTTTRQDISEKTAPS